ncbi:MAG: hypothetical protein ACEQSK_05600 [Sphingomonadaceae bacterium]
MTEPISLTLAELSARWHLSERAVLERALQHGLPLYFYFDGLVFDFGDKWLRANGDAEASRQLASQQERHDHLALSLQRQARYRAGWLELSAWETPFDEAAIASHEAEVQRLAHEVAQLSARLTERTAARQRCVRNGLLRAAPRTLKALAEHQRIHFPAYAYLPPAPDTDAAGRAAVVALEDGFPLRRELSASDLCVALRDVQQWETALAGAPHQQPD